MAKLDENIRRQAAALYSGNELWLQTATLFEGLMEVSKLPQADQQKIVAKVGPKAPLRILTYDDFKDDIV